MKNLIIIWALLISLISSSAVANTDVAFAYQGRVRVGGVAFEGQGQFKFAIVATNGSTVLWTHDGTGFDTGIPTGHVTLPVEDGIFNAVIGDTNAGMTAINSTIFNSPTPLKLRVWFSNGPLGFQQLNPDYNLVNLALNTLHSSVSDFTIYVDGQNGNDSNNGLTLSRAKKTIQAAVDTLPERIRCNITIDIADGTYRESVNVFGLTVEPGKSLILLGDQNWNGTGEPAVRLTGTDNDTQLTWTRKFGVNARQCSGVSVKGISFDSYTAAGVQFENGIYEISNCKLSRNHRGLFATDSTTTCSYVTITGSGAEGFLFAGQATALLLHCSSTNNQFSGITLNNGSIANLRGSGNFSNNGENGYKVQHHSRIVFSLAPPAYSGIVSNNKGAGMSLSYMSYSENHTVNSFVGNAMGAIHTLYGGMTTY